MLHAVCNAANGTRMHSNNARPLPKNKAAEATKWAQQKFASLKIGQVRAMEANFKEKWDQRAPGEVPYVGKITDRMMYGAAGALVVFWLVVCGCLPPFALVVRRSVGFGRTLTCGRTRCRLSACRCVVDRGGCPDVGTGL